MIGNGQRIAVLVIAQQKLALVVGAPQVVGLLSQRQCRTLSATTHSAAALNQSMAIENCMNGALGWNRDLRESAQQLFADLSSTPAGVLLLYVENELLHLERKLVGVTIRTATSIRETFQTAILIAIKDLVPCLARNAEFPAQRLARAFPLIIGSMSLLMLIRSAHDVLRGLADDAPSLVHLALRSRTALIAESLFFRKQLAFCQEHEIRPRRLTNAARLSLVLSARFFDWRSALLVVKPAI